MSDQSKNSAESVLIAESDQNKKSKNNLFSILPEQRSFLGLYINEKLKSQKPELMVIVLQSAISALRKGNFFMELGKSKEKSDEFAKAIKILQELSMILDKDSTQVAILKKLYNYCQQKIYQGNIRNKESEIQEAITIIFRVKGVYQECMLKRSA